ncbi:MULTISPECIES: factor-independent urate hydroxylase [Cyanophyceae]|uniref:factor-independent urate hydroxylase n=1 Tax=Cyanophyceae TaxID=3028117 RepID=UPI00168842EE|nr:urate oxidase [Trichocoleus sp. FACHB-69]MBD1931187.1 urate oxidase [Trichocoleus sp. FACHB-69]
MSAEISYGKGNITLYRTYAKPMLGLTEIPESEFSGRENILFAVDVDVEVFGNNFIAAYTEGINTDVVATDTMKNFVLKKAITFDGSTLEGFINFLGQEFLNTYPQMRSLRVTGREQPFAAAHLPHPDGGNTNSEVLFSRSRNDYAVTVLDFEREGDGTKIVAHSCGRVGFQLIKVTGSLFANFARDEYTTLPEMSDRPLFIYLDVYWKYADVENAIASDLSHYIPAEQVRDFVQVVFHEFVSKSIQHLVYEMGVRLLQRFPQMAEVSFAAENRLWDTAFVSDADSKIKVYCDPRPPYGMIKLTLNRDE